jgi:hypothetical protein
MMKADGLDSEGVDSDNNTGSLDLRHEEPLPRKYSRDPIRYYFDNFRHSSWFKEPEVEPANQLGPNERRFLVVGKEGSDRRIPELFGNKPYDPFLVDVFIIGRVIRKALVEVCNIYPCF